MINLLSEYEVNIIYVNSNEYVWMTLWQFLKVPIDNIYLVMSSKALSLNVRRRLGISASKRMPINSSFHARCFHAATNINVNVPTPHESLVARYRVMHMHMQMRGMSNDVRIISSYYAIIITNRLSSFLLYYH